MPTNSSTFPTLILPQIRKARLKSLSCDIYQVNQMRIALTLHSVPPYSPLLALLALLALALALLGHSTRHVGEAALSHDEHLVPHRIFDLQATSQSGAKMRSS